MHSMTKMFSFKLTLRKETRKSMDLTIPMGQKYHSKEVGEMVKGHEEKYIEANKLLEQVQKNMKNMPIKHAGIWSLRLGNTCG